MTKALTRRLARGILPVLLALAAVPALAQTTTAKISGTVADESGGPLPGVTVTATNTDSGVTRNVVTGGNGFYALTVSPGPYELTASLSAFTAEKKSFRAQVGQSLDQNFTLRLATAVKEEVAVVATADVVPEVHTSEVATNVTVDQIKSLPQATRNFLNFAALAPGVRLSTDELRQEAGYGTQGAVNTNVFIDGTSYKNDILLGGVVGQDSSRGNPFPQNAIQEFRVVTQNFKAEYQKASSAIITAVTKSGGAEFHGDVFAYYQNKSLVSQDEFSERRGEAKPEYTRWQTGLSLGGPVVKDKLHFFASYEGNYQDREYSVYRGTNMDWPTAFRDQFKSYEGLYTSPFRSTLVFGKVSAYPGNGASLDVSGDWRHENDVRGFGGQTTYQAAENVKNDVGTIRAKYTSLLGSFLNEATVSYQRYKWNPVPQDSSVIAQDYQGLMRIGSKDSQQNFTQDRLAIRDDLTLTTLQWLGDHVVKGGVTFDYLKYHVVKELNGNPLFIFRANTFINTPGDMPYTAVYGVGDPDLSTTNTQFGLYLQDDWRASASFTVNLGLRWDFETDMLNNDYVTPQAVRDGLGGVYPSNYFTDGSDRGNYYGAIQPRIGLSWDLFKDGKTVVHGGYGRYFDRTLYNDILDERYRLQYRRTEFWFSADGSPQDGRPAIRWDPSYLSLAGLQALLASGQAPDPEVWLLDNNTKPPSSDQWSLGVRQALGPIVAAVSYTGVKSKNQIVWTCGIKLADKNCDWGARPGAAQDLGFSLISRSRETWYDAVNVVLDKPFTTSSGWGAYLSYVWSKAKSTGSGGDLIAWHDMDPIYGNEYRAMNDQTHAIVLSGIVALPWGFRASTLVSLGSGYPFKEFDASRGWDKFREVPGAGDSPKWTESVDLRLEKQFTFAGSYNVGVSLEAINVFNYTNYSYGTDWDMGFIPPAGDSPNQNYGKPTRAVNPRRLQVGLSFGF